MKLLKSAAIVLLFLSTVAFAQTYEIKGTVEEAATGEALVGANVYLQGTAVGAATDVSGTYSFNAYPGSYTLVASYIGYEKQRKEIVVDGDMTIDFALSEYEFQLTVEVIADRAKERETPVAFSDLEKKEITHLLGSRDIPMALNTTPSVYATQQGGGAGDARVNIRGFDQRNVAIMINGIPVNDMENGWVYWSNWDGVGDVTSSMQVQRGLSAINLATPSVGGTMNVLTDPTAHKAGGSLKQELGNDGFFKTTLVAHSGLINDKFAVSAAGVRKVGDGLVDKTWTDAWAYYFGASYNLNSTNRLEAYYIGAPQRHGQNLYKQNVAAYSHDYAKDLDSYNELALQDFPEAEAGRKYNENWNYVRESYTGKQFYYDSEYDRYDESFLNERENFYSKPLANVNWYSKLTDMLSLYTTVYYSGGEGGGTGTYGSVEWDYSGPSRIADWNATLDQNMESDTARGILRNSRNNQWTIGAISRAFVKLSDNLNASVGVDWRTAEIEHYREVRDLLGGKFFVYTGNDFDATDADYRKGLGDKIHYNFTNTVDWIGGYGQLEFSDGPITAYGMFGYSTIAYTYTNHFVKADDGGELTAEPDAIGGFQVKGGASYRLTPEFSAFANGGYVSKVPIFDQVIDDYNAAVADDPKNEKFVSFEVGVDYASVDRKYFGALDFYYTNWSDRTQSRGYTNPDGTEGIIFLEGLGVNHMGVELEGSYQPIRQLRVNAAASIGDWVYTDDVSGSYRTYDTDAGAFEEVGYNYYIKDLKVGDAPQTQFALGLTGMPVEGMTASVIYKYYMSHYAQFDPFSRNDETDREQSWETPAYGLLDFHFNYRLPFNVSGVNFHLFAHVFNVLDEIYVQDAVDNSRDNGWDPDDETLDDSEHDADDAEVFLGLPRSFNAGVRIEL